MNETNMNGRDVQLSTVMNIIDKIPSPMYYEQLDDRVKVQMYYNWVLKNAGNDLQSKNNKSLKLNADIIMENINDMFCIYNYNYFNLPDLKYCSVSSKSGKSYNCTSIIFKLFEGLLSCGSNIIENINKELIIDKTQILSEYEDIIKKTIKSGVLKSIIFCAPILSRLFLQCHHYTPFQIFLE